MTDPYSTPEARAPYVCDACGRLRPGCDGGDDEAPGTCDRCFAAATGESDAADHSCPVCEPERWRREGIVGGDFGE